MEKFLVANWKMNKGDDDGISLLKDFAALPIKEGCSTIVCPPFTILSLAREILEKTDLYLGGQDCSPFSDGAHTGDISAHMLHMMGATAVILGHSERRQHHQETSDIIRHKAQQAMKHNLLPIICVGESIEAYEAHNTLSVVQKQIEASIPKEDGPFMIAYEPIWAIGSGKTPKTKDIEAVTLHIDNLFQIKKPILYGGSVNPNNAKDFLSIPSVSGLLVGGASLKIEQFKGILGAY